MTCGNGSFSASPCSRGEPHLIAKYTALLSLLLWATGEAFAQSPDIKGAVPSYSPTNETRIYTPSSRGAVASFGEMSLSNTHLAFSKFAGKMDLELAGVLPAGSERAGSPVYRVLNAQEYFRDSPICNTPVRWVALEFLTVAPTKSSRKTAVGGWVYLSRAAELGSFDARSCSGEVFWSILVN